MKLPSSRPYPTFFRGLAIALPLGAFLWVLIYYAAAWFLSGVAV